MLRLCERAREDVWIETEGREILGCCDLKNVRGARGRKNVTVAGEHFSVQFASLWQLRKNLKQQDGGKGAVTASAEA